MITYNHAPYVSQAIESVLAQITDFSLELVIGDDCSVDGTAQICFDYARRDPRVKLLMRDSNVGVWENFSDVLAACQGEYVAICEGDDFWTDPYKLAKQVALLDAHSQYGGSAHQSNVLRAESIVKPFRPGVAPALAMEDLVGGRPFHTASLVFRRDASRIFLAAPKVLSCDRLLYLCVSMLGRIHYEDEAMCVYRLHGGGLSSNVTVDQLKLDLDGVAYLTSVRSSFPASQYRAYIYATIGLCARATRMQRVRFLSAALFYYSVAFPGRIGRLLRGAFGPRILYR
jgi:glycosyltransferase involved in cell wall biosynthesis